jgi:outer membrane protein assembly factor BamD
MASFLLRTGSPIQGRLVPGDFWGAYKSYKVMVEKYPASNFFDNTLERLYSIGNLYLAGEPARLWKIPIGPSMDKTVEIYESIIKAAPYGKYAPEAQFKIGLAREKQKKFSDAVAAYNTLIDKYPGNDIVDDAQYQIGHAWLKASSEPEYDQSAAEKSIEAFQDFIVRYPNSEKIDQAKEYIGSLNGRQTAGSFNIAKFYESQRNLKAAYIYYNEVIRQNPDSSQAQIAKKKVQELRPLVEKELNLPPLAANTPAESPATTTQ